MVDTPENKNHQHCSPTNEHSKQAELSPNQAYQKLDTGIQDAKCVYLE